MVLIDRVCLKELERFKVGEFMVSGEGVNKKTKGERGTYIFYRMKGKKLQI